MCVPFSGTEEKKGGKKSVVLICYLKSKQTLCSEDAHTAGSKITKIRITADFIIFISVFVQANILTLIHPLDLYKTTTVPTGRIPQSAKHPCND